MPDTPTLRAVDELYVGRRFPPPITARQTLRVEAWPADRGELVIPLPGKPGSDEAVDATIEAMRAVIADVGSVADMIAPEMAPIVDIPAELYRYFQTHFSFMRDPQLVEKLRHPMRMFDNIDRTGKTAGDCDDLAMTGCVLLRSFRTASVLIVVGREPRGRFEHVMFGAATFTLQAPVTFAGSEREVRDRVKRLCIPLDPQERTPIGQLPPGVKRARVYPV